MSRFAKQRESQKSSRELSAHIQPIQNAYLSLVRTQRALAGMVVACGILGFTVFRMSSDALGRRAFTPIIVSTSLLAFAFTVRNSMMMPALDELRRNPRDPNALKKWNRYTLVMMVLCAAVGLTGFGVQLLGAAAPIPLTMYAIALAYLFLLRPIKP